MNYAEAADILSKLSASGSHVMVNAHVPVSMNPTNGHGITALFDSPVPAYQAQAALAAIDAARLTWKIRRFR